VTDVIEKTKSAATKGAAGSAAMNGGGHVTPEMKGVTYSPTGLEIDPGTDFERWAEIGYFVGSLHRSSAWFIGDWILYGEHKFGQMYAQAVNDLGLDYKTCVNTVYVCRHVPKERRRADLPFSHHAEVAGIKTAGEQRRYLKLAASNNWTKAELREAIKHGGILPERVAQPDWSSESGIHPGADTRLLPDSPRDADHEAAQASSPGQTIPGVTHARGEVLPPPSESGAFIPDSADEVYQAAAKIAPAAIEVVKSRGKKGIRDLREALLAAGYEI
jgi:hypothetical protein